MLPIGHFFGLCVSQIIPTNHQIPFPKLQTKPLQIKTIYIQNNTITLFTGHVLSPLPYTWHRRKIWIFLKHELQRGLKWNWHKCWTIFTLFGWLWSFDIFLVAFMTVLYLRVFPEPFHRAFCKMTFKEFVSWTALKISPQILEFSYLNLNIQKALLGINGSKSIDLADMHYFTSGLYLGECAWNLGKYSLWAYSILDIGGFHKMGSGFIKT